MTAQTQTTVQSKRPFLVPPFVYKQLLLFKTLGFKAYLKSSGKWVFLGIVLFYLVRDVTLYIVLPYLVINGFISFPGGTP